MGPTIRHLPLSRQDKTVSEQGNGQQGGKAGLRTGGVKLQQPLPCSCDVVRSPNGRRGKEPGLPGKKRACRQAGQEAAPRKRGAFSLTTGLDVEERQPPAKEGSCPRDMATGHGTKAANLVQPDGFPGESAALPGLLFGRNGPSSAVRRAVPTRRTVPAACLSGRNHCLLNSATPPWGKTMLRMLPLT